MGVQQFFSLFIPFVRPEKRNGEEDKMASTSKLNFLTLSSTSDTSSGSLDLHEMFSIVGNQMTTKDVRSLKFLYKRIMPKNIYSKVNDGYTFLLALEKIGRLDETNFTYLLQVLRIITRHDLSQYVHLRRRGTVKADPVDEYLLRTTRRSTPLPDTQTVRATIPATSKRRSTDVEQTVVERPAKRPHLVHLHSTRLTRSHSSGIEERQETCHTNSTNGPAASCSHESADHSPEIKKKVTCDIRLRVRAEYCDHDTALEGNIFSNKPDMLERQFEKFMQANTILKSRDLGSIICDIKFSELTYLDAFWRDYINGSLLEALKGVFITESLKQAVGHEAIKLLVNVDEDDYEAGREKLLQNLSE